MIGEETDGDGRPVSRDSHCYSSLTDKERWHEIYQRVRSIICWKRMDRCDLSKGWQLSQLSMVQTVFNRSCILQLGLLSPTTAYQEVYPHDWHETSSLCTQ